MRVCVCGRGCMGRWVGGGLYYSEEDKRKSSPATENSNNSAFVSILIRW